MQTFMEWSMTGMKRTNRAMIGGSRSFSTMSYAFLFPSITCEHKQFSCQPSSTPLKHWYSWLYNNVYCILFMFVNVLNKCCLVGVGRINKHNSDKAPVLVAYVFKGDSYWGRTVADYPQSLIWIWELVLVNEL